MIESSFQSVMMPLGVIGGNMIKSITAVTREIDDIEAAVEEIVTALNIEENLLRNSLGIISCFSEFHETGVLKAICDALPFECVGATSVLSSADGETDQIIFIITVLTSDDCEFETIVLPLTENYAETINEELSGLLSKREDKPTLMLSYFPIKNTVSGDMILDVIDNASGGVPLFGTMAIDHLPDYSTSRTIHNGDVYKEASVLGLIYGNVNYSFEIASLNEEKIGKQEAIITESNGSILIGVNEKSVLEFLNEVGISRSVIETGLGILPLVVDHRDGTKPVARAVFALTPEGYAVCGGAMPVGATIAVGRISMDDVLQTTENIVRHIDTAEGIILGYSCMARYLAMGPDIDAEARKMCEITGGEQYLFSVSGGEICPLPNANGRLKNVFHNYTIVLCRLN